LNIVGPYRLKPFFKAFEQARQSRRTVLAPDRVEASLEVDAVKTVSLLTHLLRR